MHFCWLKFQLCCGDTLLVVGWGQEVIVFGLKILQTLLEMVLKLGDLLEVKGIQPNSPLNCKNEPLLR